MQKILSLLRRCVEDYQMIAPGERVGVGVSGGKDSLLLLAALARLARFYPGGFSVEAFTVDMGIPGMNLSPVADWCRREGIPFHRIPTQMYHVIFETRQEKNPCALCAKMRRGSLHTALREAGIHKVALGHHYDDAVETFFLSLFYEGRLSCFHPVTYLDRMDITQIRPPALRQRGHGPGGRPAPPAAGGPQPLPRRRGHQAPGGEGPHRRPGGAVPQAEGIHLRRHAAPAPAGVGGGGPAAAA